MCEEKDIRYDAPATAQPRSLVIIGNFDRESISAGRDYQQGPILIPWTLN